MAYENLAALYDGLMTDTDYEAWARYLDELLRRFACPGPALADLGCGTGSISIPLAKLGWQITGLDRSAEMLEQARQKSAAEGVQIQWLERDMTAPSLEGLAPQAVIATFDAFNYILEPEALQMLLQELYWSMAEEGLLIFDLNTPYKLRQVLGDNLYSYHDEQVDYIWENHWDQEDDLCQMQLTFFVRDEATGLYQRSEEYHEEKVYEPELIKLWLTLAGFEVLALYEPLSFEDLAEVTDQAKVLFVARRRGDDAWEDEA